MLAKRFLGPILISMLVLVAMIVYIFTPKPVTVFAVRKIAYQLASVHNDHHPVSMQLYPTTRHKALQLVHGPKVRVGGPVDLVLVKGHFSNKSQKAPYLYFTVATRGLYNNHGKLFANQGQLVDWGLLAHKPAAMRSKGKIYLLS